MAAPACENERGQQLPTHLRRNTGSSAFIKAPITALPVPCGRGVKDRERAAGVYRRAGSTLPWGRCSWRAAGGRRRAAPERWRASQRTRQLSAPLPSSLQAPVLASPKPRPRPCLQDGAWDGLEGAHHLTPHLHLRLRADAGLPRRPPRQGGAAAAAVAATATAGGATWGLPGQFGVEIKHKALVQAQLLQQLAALQPGKGGGGSRGTCVRGAPTGWHCRKAGRRSRAQRRRRQPHGWSPASVGRALATTHTWLRPTRK